MHSVSSLKRNRQDGFIPEVVNRWRQWLQEQDRAAGAIKKYLQAVAHFLDWYEQEEYMPLQLVALTPIVLIGYCNELQHKQRQSASTVNLPISALRLVCLARRSGLSAARPGSASEAGRWRSGSKTGRTVERPGQCASAPGASLARPGTQLRDHSSTLADGNSPERV